MAPLKLRLHASERRPKAAEAVQGGRAPTPPVLVPRALGRQTGLRSQNLHQVHKGTLSSKQTPPEDNPCLLCRGGGGAQVWTQELRCDSHF